MRNWHVTCELGLPLAIVDVSNATDPQLIRLITLEKFNLRDTVPRWEFKDDADIITEGSVAGANYRLWPEGRIVLSIPITMHRRRKGFAPAFIFVIPEGVEVHPLETLKKRFGAEIDLFF